MEIIKIATSARLEEIITITDRDAQTHTGNPDCYSQLGLWRMWKDYPFDVRNYPPLMGQVPCEQTHTHRSRDDTQCVLQHIGLELNRFPD